MVSNNKGSALPRGLSLSDRIYLAPSLPGGSDVVTVAIRNGAVVSHFADHTVEEVLRWSTQLTDHSADISAQINFINENISEKTLAGRTYPLIMGIVNVTPDSFSDGGQFSNKDAAIAHARLLTEQGADILDFGGESTRPGAAPVAIDEELKRIIPVIEACKTLGPLLSVDTRKAEVMRKGVGAGAAMINDVTALEYGENTLAIAVKSNVPICLMHSSADPKVMQDNPQYDHVLFDVIDYLKSRIEVSVQAGLDRSNIILDPGIGFGKTLEHNLVLLKGLRFLHGLGCPILLGVSRKSFIGKIDRGEDTDHRIGGSLSALMFGLAAGVHIFRVHDVKETRQAIAVWQSIDNTFLIL